MCVHMCVCTENTPHIGVHQEDVKWSYESQGEGSSNEYATIRPVLGRELRKMVNYPE